VLNFYSLFMTTHRGYQPVWLPTEAAYYRGWLPTGHYQINTKVNQKLTLVIIFYYVNHQSPVAILWNYVFPPKSSGNQAVFHPQMFKPME